MHRTLQEKQGWRWWDKLGDVITSGKKQGGLDGDSGRGFVDSFNHFLFDTYLLCTYYVPGKF